MAHKYASFSSPTTQNELAKGHNIFPATSTSTSAPVPLHFPKTTPGHWWSSRGWSGPVLGASTTLVSDFGSKTHQPSCWIFLRTIHCRLTDASPNLSFSHILSFLPLLSFTQSKPALWASDSLSSYSHQPEQGCLAPHAYVLCLNGISPVLSCLFCLWHWRLLSRNWTERRRLWLLL